MIGEPVSPREPPPTALDYAPAPSGLDRPTRIALGLAVPAGALAGVLLWFCGPGFVAPWLLLTTASVSAVCLMASSRRVLVALLPPPAMFASYAGLYFARTGVPPYTSWVELALMMLLLTLVSEAWAMMLAGLLSVGRPRGSSGA
jgi:hypothetical protein